jgi:hypothetical protein
MAFTGGDPLGISSGNISLNFCKKKHKHYKHRNQAR